MAIHNVSKLLACAALALVMANVVPPAGAAPVFNGDSHSGAYLGVMVDVVSPEKTASLHLKDGAGAAIAGVDQDGPGFRAGLKQGDIIVAFNGKPVEGPEQLAGLIHSSAPGTTATVSIFRNGQNQEVKVTLGDWKQMASMPKPPIAAPGSMPFVSPMPPMPSRTYPDIDMPSFTQLSTRHGLVVEALSPQLCDFFGVPQNKGVLIRSVEKGSPGTAAGLKAGDVIVRINNETVHDIADWRRALKTHGSKVTLVVVRDRKEQTIELNLPANSSELKTGDWDVFDQDMEATAAETQELGPEFAKNEQDMDTLALLDPEQIDEAHRQAESTSRSASAEVKKQAEEMRKQAEQMRKQADAAVRTMTPQMKRQAEELRKEAEQMAPELAKSAKQMSDAMKPTAKELAGMARDMAQTAKEMEPQLKLDMEQLKKELELEQREWQDIFKGTDSRQHF
jgi:membrane-associated protease RseP (regulator of RpoE activity)